MNLLIIGAPGTGKGTMSNLITSEYNIPHVSTRDMLRAAIANGTEVGLSAQKYMNEGKLVPDEVIHGVIVERLSADDIKTGFLLDGYPRSLNQAEDFQVIMDEVGMKVDLVLNLVIDEEILKERITGRRICKNCGEIFHIKNKPTKVEGICDKCGHELSIRKDDTLESLKTRLDEYHNTTAPVLDYYRKQGLVTDIDASKSVEEVFAAVQAAIKEAR